MALPTISKGAEISALLAECRFLKVTAAESIAAMEAGPVSANRVLELVQRLQAGKSGVLIPASASDGLAAKLVDELRLKDVKTAEDALQVVLAAVTAVVESVIKSFPQSDGFILKDRLNQDGSVTVRQFTREDTAELRAELQRIVDAIG